jgi:PilZ domain
MLKDKEKRKERRRPMRYTAWVALADEHRHGCVVSDASDSGARIDVQDSDILPDSFVLLLTSNGTVKRYCRVMWRKPTQVGVKFAKTLADAALAPKLGDKSGAPPADAETADAPAEAEPAKAG